VSGEKGEEIFYPKSKTKNSKEPKKLVQKNKFGDPPSPPPKERVICYIAL